MYSLIRNPAPELKFRNHDFWNICLHAAFPAERDVETDADEGAEKGAGGGGEAHRVEGDRVPDRASDAILVFCTDEAADHDGGAHGEADDHDGHHVHDLRTDRNRRDDIRAIEAACDEQIGEPVKHLQEVAEQVREWKQNHIMEEIALREIMLSHGKSSI